MPSPPPWRPDQLSLGLFDYRKEKEGCDEAPLCIAASVMCDVCVCVSRLPHRDMTREYVRYSNVLSTVRVDSDQPG